MDGDIQDLPEWSDKSGPFSNQDCSLPSVLAQANENQHQPRLTVLYWLVRASERLVVWANTVNFDAKHDAFIVSPQTGVHHRRVSYTRDTAAAIIAAHLLTTSRQSRH
jgi:hypothetical protein